MNLLELQRRMAAAMMVPLRAEGRIAKKTFLGRSMSAEATSMIKPNDRLTSLERLEIYSRSYWFRLLDSLTEDFPGLEAIVGRDNFARMANKYLQECPSRSFTLRDLGAQLADWLAANPVLLANNRELAMDMARLEWAHIVAFDGDQDPVLDAQHLLAPGPRMRIGIQPYVTLLTLRYPVDELRVAIRSEDESREAASNSSGNRRVHAVRKIGRLPQQQLFVAVHRVDSSVYYRRLEPEEFQVLAGLRDGRTLRAAIGDAFEGTMREPDQIPVLLESWFAAWARFGWLTVFRKRTKGSTSK